MPQPSGYSPTYIATATTTLVYTGPCVLHTIVLGETAAGTISIYNGLTAGGTLIGVLKASIAENTFLFDASCDVGICIVTAGASKLTVNWQRT